MKILLIILIALPSIVYSQYTDSRYKSGFVFYEHGTKVTLLKWIDVGHGMYRWKANFQLGNISGIGYTDDCIIDLYTDKAYIDTRRQKIIPYDSLEKWYPDYAERVRNYNHQ